MHSQEAIYIAIISTLWLRFTLVDKYKKRKHCTSIAKDVIILKQWLVIIPRLGTHILELLVYKF